MRHKITAIVPCYNEEEVLELFYEEICRVAERMREQVDFEFLFVNDGSTDRTLDKMKQLRAGDSRVCYLSFSRNFGKEAAMYAGLEHSTGDFTAVLDADLQHPPDLLIEMYRSLTEEAYDSAAAQRVNRAGEPRIRSFVSKRFYRVLAKLSKIEVVEGEVDYRLMSRAMVNAVLQMSERNRFTKGIFSWVGFRTKWIPYENVERAAGETKWSFTKLMKYSLEGIISFSTAPLAMVSVLGIFFCVCAMLAILYIVVKTIVWGDPVGGWPSLACIILGVSGIQLFCMGILGQYLGKTYLEVKNRPIYLAAIVETNEKQEGAAAGDGRGTALPGQEAAAKAENQVSEAAGAGLKKNQQKTGQLLFRGSSQ